MGSLTPILLTLAVAAGSGGSLDRFAFFRVERRGREVPETAPDGSPVVGPGFRWPGRRDWAWFLGDLAVPEKIGDAASAGRPVGLRISCGAGGEVYVDGALRVRYDNDKPALVLLEEAATPGRRHRIAIQAQSDPNREAEAAFSEAAWVLIDPARAREPCLFRIDAEETTGPVPDGIIGVSQGGGMADYEEATAQALREAGVRWFRMDNVLTPCVRREGGKIAYDFTDLDRRMDFLHAVGAEAIIAASYMPEPLDAVPDGERHSAPRDYGAWEELCYRVARRCLDRGRRVAFWEVWNEPNTGWLKPGPEDTGSKEFEKIYAEATGQPSPERGVVRMFEAYCKLYRATARGVLRADPEARIGGPALASGPFEHAERGHCFNGKGYARGLMLWCRREKLPLDFVSWHEYFQAPEVFRAEAETFRRYLAEFPELERSVRSFMVTEWNEAWWADSPQDNEIGAAWCASTVTRAFLPAGIDRPCFFYAKQGDDTFRGDYAMLMAGNVPKPQYHVVKLFNSLAGQWLAVRGEDGELSCVAARERAKGRLAVVVVNHTDRYNLRRRARISVANLPAAICREYRIDATHANVYHDRAKSALEALRETRHPGGTFEVDLALPAHSVTLLELRSEKPAERAARPPSAPRDAGAPAGAAAGVEREARGDGGTGAAPKRVALVTDPEPGPGTRHALAKLEAALAARGIAARRVTSAGEAKASREERIVVAGLAAGSGEAARALGPLGEKRPSAPESLLVRRARIGGRPAILAAGADDRGLMYALLDIAGAVASSGAAEAPFARVREAREAPYVPERALSMYTMHRSVFEPRLHDERFWERYFDLMSRSRFSTFVLIFGYENWGYFSPPYPWFFDVEGHDEVRLVGITPAEQERNLAALRRVIALAHSRGLDFTLGIWDHIYRGGVQGPRELTRKPTRGLVWGLGAENLGSYTVAAIAKLLEKVPDLDALQFRMHGESGLRRSEMREFWTRVYRTVKKARPDIRFDARAKNFPDSLIDAALAEGLRFRLTTKYWMEQMGLPFHPTHIHPRNQHDRRHGYADLLRYPRRYPMHWRLWSGGTSRILLWGSPEYVGRFARSTHLYDGEGFEVNEPLATKMQDQPQDAASFHVLTSAYRTGEYEFERYWPWFVAWGRYGYDPHTPEEVWRGEFVRRFGPQAGPIVARALESASRILPRIVAYTYPYHQFPTTRGWVELERQEELPVYARALPSDTEQFLGPDQAARLQLAGRWSGAIGPERSSRWFARVATEVSDLARRAEAAAGARKSPELAVALADLGILAGLARYHARRALAGLDWALWKRSGDLSKLDGATAHEREALAAWRGIVQAAGDVYAGDLIFGRRSAGLAGHWRDRVPLLEKGIAALEEERAEFRPGAGESGPSIAHVPARRARPGEAIEIRATLGARGDLRSSRLGFRRAGGGWSWRELEPERAPVYGAEIPAEAVAPGLEYALEAIDSEGRRSLWPAGGLDAPFEVLVTSDREPPRVEHERPASAPASRPLRIRARITDPSGVGAARLHYRSVTQFDDYRVLALEPVAGSDTWEATIPPEHVDPAWDFQYYIEAIDTSGNGAIWPDLERETPYVVVRLER